MRVVFREIFVDEFRNNPIYSDEAVNKQYTVVYSKKKKTILAAIFPPSMLYIVQVQHVLYSRGSD